MAHSHFVSSIKFFAVLILCLVALKVIEKFQLFKIRITFSDSSTVSKNVYLIPVDSWNSLSKSTYGAIRKKEVIESVQIAQYDVTLPLPKEAELIECIVLKNAHPPYNVCLAANDYVSQIVKRSFSWEEDIQSFMKQFFKDNPTAMFFDLGMNVGIHSLYAAAQNPHVEILGVEPFPENIIILHKAAHLNIFQNRFTVIVAAVSSRRGSVTAVGGYSGLTITGKNNLTKGFQVNTITINDLTPFLKGRKVLLKMDIERSECHVMQNADKIFADVDIPAIIMEIGATVHEGSCCFESMLRFLADRNYEAFYFDDHPDFGAPLNFSKWKSWDFKVNIYFKKSIPTVGLKKNTN